MEETKEGICDSSALSVFLLSENEGGKKLKAQAFIGVSICVCVCVREKEASC